MAIHHSSSTLEPLQSVRGEYAQDALHYKAAALAARLADRCVSASFLPDLWSTYYERFHGVLSAEMNLPAQ
jgi:hypothetical protein